MKRLVLFLGILLILLAGFSLFFSMQKKTPVKVVHYHAGFHVYVDGKLQDFSAIQYMHDKPCTEKKDEEKEDEQVAKAHLHDAIDDVVHVHREHAMWKDLFTNLHYTFPAGKPVQAYINGKVVSDILALEIHPYDSAVITIGKTDLAQDLRDAVTKEQIIKVEKGSETCGKP